MKIVKFQPIHLLLLVLLLSCSDKMQFDETDKESVKNPPNLRIPRDQVPPTTFVSNNHKLRVYEISPDKLRIKDPVIIDTRGNIIKKSDKLIVGSEYQIKFNAPIEYDLFIKAHEGFEMISLENKGLEKVLKVKYIDETVEKIYLSVTPIKKNGARISEKLTPVNFLLPN
jgi:hypothetical protein